MVRWVMRKKRYVGALRAERGYLLLMTLRNADQVIQAAELEPARGRELDRRETEMAQRLIDSLADDLDMSAYRDAYRERVCDLIATKRKGGKLRLPAYREPEETESLAATLQASLDALTTH